MDVEVSQRQDRAELHIRAVVVGQALWRNDGQRLGKAAPPLEKTLLDGVELSEGIYRGRFFITS